MYIVLGMKSRTSHMLGKHLQSMHILTPEASFPSRLPRWKKTQVPGWAFQRPWLNREKERTQFCTPSLLLARFWTGLFSSVPSSLSSSPVVWNRNYMWTVSPSHLCCNYIWRVMWLFLTITRMGTFFLFMCFCVCIIAMVFILLILTFNSTCVICLFAMGYRPSSAVIFLCDQRSVALPSWTSFSWLQQ